VLLFLDLKAQYAGKKIKISSELYKKGCVTNPEEGLLAAQKIGFPVMIKASEGGGGKGIRKVEASEEFASALRQVSKYQKNSTTKCSCLSSYHRFVALWTASFQV
jgi:biotin carboxylase